MQNRVLIKWLPSIALCLERLICLRSQTDYLFWTGGSRKQSEWDILMSSTTFSKFDGCFSEDTPHRSPWLCFRRFIKMRQIVHLFVLLVFYWLSSLWNISLMNWEVGFGTEWGRQERNFCWVRKIGVLFFLRWMMGKIKTVDLSNIWRMLSPPEPSSFWWWLACIPGDFEIELLCIPGPTCSKCQCSRLHLLLSVSVSFDDPFKCF